MRMRFILLSFLLFISCNRRELTYYEVVGVTLMADWSQAGLEGEDTYGATAVFYPKWRSASNRTDGQPYSRHHPFAQRTL